MEIYGLSPWQHGGEFAPAEFAGLQFAPGAPLAPAAQTLLDTMQARFEKAVASTLTISGLTTPMREWLSRNRGSLPHLEELLKSEAAKAAMPDLYTAGPPWEAAFVHLPALVLAGHLAQHLYDGGAYPTHMSQLQAAQVADNCQRNHRRTIRRLPRR